MGDSKIGKTCLLYAYKDGKMTQEEEIRDFLPTFSRKVKVDGRKMELGIWDTSGDSQYDGLRRLAYPSGDVFVLCYSVDNRQSYENVTKKWLPELRKLGRPNAPLVVVGLKQDLRPRTSLMPSSNGGTDGTSTRDHFVAYDEGLQLANEVRAWGFLECTARREDSACNVFGQVAEAILKQEKERKGSK